MSTSVNSALDVRPALQNDRMLRSGYEDFRSLILFTDGPGDTTVPETTGPNLLITDKNIFEYEGVGTLDSAVGSQDGTGGLLLTAMMTSNNVGLELRPSLAAGTRGRATFVPGTDDAFYASLKFTLADVSGANVCMFGFRKVEAMQTAADTEETYTDIAVLDAISGDIKIKTILDDGTTTTTDTTQNWADTEEHKFTVLVDGTGKVTYEIDNLAPTATAAFTFNSGDTITPFFRIQNDTDVANGTVLSEYAWGFQGDSVCPRKSGVSNTGGI